MNFCHTFQFLEPEIYIVLFGSIKLRNLGNKEVNIVAGTEKKFSGI